jgi:mRNA interferase MazF
MPDPRRGEVWVGRLSPVVGHEQGGTRPVLVVSVDEVNGGPAGLVVVVPLTSRTKYSVPVHVPVAPPEGGLRLPSVVLCDAVRSISRDRLVTRWGTVSADTMDAVGTALGSILAL